MRKKVKLALYILMAMCALILVVGMLLTNFSSTLRQEFRALMCAHINTYTVAQCAEVSSRIDTVCSMLEGMAVMAGTDAARADNLRLEKYISMLNASTPYRYDYYSETELEILRGYKNDTAFTSALNGGKAFLTEVEYSAVLGGYYFSAGVPVMKDGRAVAALRAQINAALLRETTQSHEEHEVTSCIIKGDGTMVSTAQEAAPFLSLQQVFVRFSLPDAQLQEVLANMAAGTSEAYCLEQAANKEVYMAVSPLGYQDWHIVNFLYGNGYENYSDTIFQATLVIVLILVLVLCVIAGTIILMQGYFRRQAALMNDRYHMLSDLSGEALLSIDYIHGTLEFSEQFLRQYGIDTEKLHNNKGKASVLEEYLHSDLLGQEQKEFYAQLLHNDCVDLECLYTFPSGSKQWVAGTSKQVRGKDGNIMFTVAKLVNIHERKEKEAALLDASLRDSMTGFFNKMTTQKKIDGILSEGGTGSLVLLDVDEFKAVNDTYGHSAGDEVLRKISAVLGQQFRKMDVVGRVGGDEFVVFLRDMANRTGIEAKMQTVLAEVRGIALQQAEGMVHVSLSMGVATARAGESYIALFARADQAMYKAKQAGRDGCAFAD